MRTRRHKSEDENESRHRDRWLLSYADLLTLLLALFIVMYAASDKERAKQIAEVRLVRLVPADVHEHLVRELLGDCRHRVHVAKRRAEDQIEALARQAAIDLFGLRAFAAQQGAGQVEARTVAGLRQPLQRRAARVAETQGLGDLVEGLARRIVDGRAEPGHIADAAHFQQLAVAARDQQQKERIIDRLAEPRRDRMTLQMVDGDQRQAPRQGDRLAETQPDHDAADQSRPGGGGNAVQGVIAEPRLVHGQPDDAVDHLDMAAGRDLGHDAAIGRVIVNLAVHHRGQDRRLALRRQAHHRGGGLVAAGLEAEHGERTGCPAPVAAIVGGPLHRVEVATQSSRRNDSWPLSSASARAARNWP